MTEEDRKALIEEYLHALDGATAAVKELLLQRVALDMRLTAGDVRRIAERAYFELETPEFFPWDKTLPGDFK